MALEYRLDEDRDCSGCASSGRETPLREAEPHGMSQRDTPVYLCELCHGTLASNVPMYPGQHHHAVSAAEMYRHVNAVANIMLRKIISALDGKKTS